MDSNANSFENLNNLKITGTKTEFRGAIPLFMFNTYEYAYERLTTLFQVSLP